MTNLFRVIEFPIISLVSFIGLKKAIWFAYCLRGYRAIGGEILVFPLIGIVMYFMFETAIALIEETENDEYPFEN